MGKAVKELYRERGLVPPTGKGIHTMKFHWCVVKCAEKQGGVIDKSEKGGVNCWAVCMASVGKEEAVRPAHQR